MNKDIENIKQQLEEVIKKNLPEKKECDHHTGFCMNKDCATDEVNKALSQINTSLITDEVLKVVVEKIINGNYWDFMDKEMFNEELRKLLK